jgi:type IV pilus assembly protein PilZ
MKNINLSFISDRELYLSYMPFFKSGGVFIRTTDDYAIGEEIELEIMLPDALEASTVYGVISWITPPGVQNGTPPGVGVSFTEDKEKVRDQIEKTLGRLLSSTDPTLTM